jgi:hypothetical protein
MESAGISPSSAEFVGHVCIFLTNLCDEGCGVAGPVSNPGSDACPHITEGGSTSKCGSTQRREKKLLYKGSALLLTSYTGYAA